MTEQSSCDFLNDWESKADSLVESYGNLFETRAVLEGQSDNYLIPPVDTSCKFTVLCMTDIEEAHIASEMTHRPLEKGFCDTMRDGMGYSP